MWPTVFQSTEVLKGSVSQTGNCDHLHLMANIVCTFVPENNHMTFKSNVVVQVIVTTIDITLIRDALIVDLLKAVRLLFLVGSCTPLVLSWMFYVFMSHMKSQ